MERHEQAPHLFDLPGSDLVIVRAGPSTSTKEVTRLQAPIYAIESTGSVETDNFGTAWRELHVYSRVGYLWTGWLEADRLEISERTQVSFFDEPCAEAGISEGAVPVNGLPDDAAASSTPSGVADQIAQMWQLSGPGCHRLHVALGKDWYYGGELASEAPEGVTVEAFGSWARITVPGLTSPRSDADLDDTWNLTALAARTVDGEIAIDVYAPAPSEFAVRALSDPARLLIDVIPAEDVSDAATAAVPKLFAASNTIVPFPAPNDGSTAEVTLPRTVRGYSRWYEGDGDAELLLADGSPALGSAKGDLLNPGINTGSRWAVRANDWTVAWGTFEFTIEAITPLSEDTIKEYRLLVSEYGAIDDEDFEEVFGTPKRFVDTPKRFIDKSEYGAIDNREFWGVAIPFRLAN